MAVLNINNIRDIESDRQAGKYSIPVRIGRRNAIRYHWFLLSAGSLSAILYTIVNYRSPWQWLFLLVLPVFVRNGMVVADKAPGELDPWLRQMALGTLAFVLLFGLGIILWSFKPPGRKRGLIHNKAPNCNFYVQQNVT